MWTLLKWSLDGTKNTTRQSIQLFESKDKSIKRHGYHFCKNESGTHLAPVPDVTR